MAESRRSCELCNDEATIYCPSDSAFLCWTCDSKVHTANFLAARHVRSPICSGCWNLNDCRFSCVGISQPAPVDFAGSGEVDSLFFSSSCVSSTTEAGEEVVSKRREKIPVGGAVTVDLKVRTGQEGTLTKPNTFTEGVLENWCRRMGVEDRKRRKVVATAVVLLRGCVDRMTVLPFRVSLAAALLVALRVRGGDTCQDLRKVVRISGVPAKLILAIESLLARVLKRKRSREDHEESWAEC